MIDCLFVLPNMNTFRRSNALRPVSTESANPSCFVCSSTKLVELALRAFVICFPRLTQRWEPFRILCEGEEVRTMFRPHQKYKPFAFFELDQISGTYKWEPFRILCEGQPISANRVQISPKVQTLSIFYF